MKVFQPTKLIESKNEMFQEYFDWEIREAVKMATVKVPICP